MLASSIIDIVTYTTDINGIIQNTRGTGFFLGTGGIRNIVIASAETMLALTFAPEKTIPYYLSRVHKIIAINVEGYSFELSLIGMSPLMNIAVLEAIDPPTFTSLRWSEYPTTSGQTVHTLYDLANRDPKAIVEGRVIDPSATDSSDPLIPELINVDIVFTPQMLGAPLIVNDGVVGLVGGTYNYTTSNGQIGTNTATGVVARILQPIVNDILNGSYVDYIGDPYGQYAKYILPSLEALFQYIGPYTVNRRLGTLDVSAPYSAHKIQGAIITQIGDESNLGSYLYVDDVIESINGQTIGLYGISVTTALSNVKVGDTIVLIVRTRSSDYNQEAYVSIVTVPMTFTDIPYPMVAIAGSLGGVPPNTAVITGSACGSTFAGLTTKAGQDWITNSGTYFYFTQSGTYTLTFSAIERLGVLLCAKRPNLLAKLSLVHYEGGGSYSTLYTTHDKTYNDGITSTLNFSVGDCNIVSLYSGSGCIPPNYQLAIVPYPRADFIMTITRNENNRSSS